MGTSRSLMPDKNDNNKNYDIKNLFEGLVNRRNATDIEPERAAYENAKLESECNTCDGKCNNTCVQCRECTFQCQC